MSEGPSFEEAVAELERIVRSLEDGKITLEQGLVQYERGVTLLRHGYAQLKAAETRIQVLTGVNPDGTPQLRPFDHTAAGEPPSRPPPPPRPKGSSGMY